MTCPNDSLKEKLTADFRQALQRLSSQGILYNRSVADSLPAINFSRPKDKAHGDFACNVALVLAKQVGKNPHQLAGAIVNALPANPLLAKAEVAGPGFINVFLAQDAKFAVLSEILDQGENFGRSQIHAGKSVQVEFVSANPTSALHIGHGRGAAYGMSVANLLEATGQTVQREYYVNDTGRQMDILATSVYLRYLQSLGESIIFPSNGYQGDYIADIAKDLLAKYGAAYQHSFNDLSTGIVPDAVLDEAGKVLSGDKEAHVDGLIANAKRLLGADYALFHRQALSVILADIQNDLSEFGVVFDRWFGEHTITPLIDETLALLDAKGLLYEQDGNWWFKSSAFGDEKDRVVRRSNGQYTYFASDIAYHKNKFDRGFDTVINVWGADHHGYVARIKAALAALGIDPSRLEVPLVQFVSLYRGTEKVPMSSRSGQFISLRELRQEVGNDAARFYYVSRTPNVPMDFDLALAKSQSRDNAVYYIQYAHARICSVFERVQALGFSPSAKADCGRLTAAGELELVKQLGAYPETILKAADWREPHLLVNYLKDLAGIFHAWYNDQRILPKSLENKSASADELADMQARLYLSQAVRQVLANGLILLGLSAPRAM